MDKKKEQKESPMLGIIKKTLHSSKDAKDVIDRILEECPDLEEERLEELFTRAGGKQVTSALVSAAYRMEYNSHHPYKHEKWWFQKYLPKGISPEKVEENPVIQKKIIQVLNQTEEEFDAMGGVSLEEIKKRIAEIFD
jgi:hypothetical protein